MQQKKRKNRTYTQPSDKKVLENTHQGFTFFHELTFNQFKIRKNKRFQSLKSKSLIEDTAIYETLQQNKSKLNQLKTEINTIREIEFNDYIKKSIRYQELLQMNDEKKKHLPTLNKNIGEVIKKSVTETYSKSIIYDMHTEQLKIQGWKPESREGHTTIIYKDQAIMIGGHCSHAFSTIQYYSFLTNTWVKQIQTPFARSYHSAILYKGRFVVIFGGMGVYDKSRKARQCHNSIGLVDLLNQNSRTLRLHNQESIEPRRSHTATLLGKYMIVLGGINMKKDYLNDFVYLDLKELRWYHKEYKVEGKQFQEFFENGIAKHAGVSTFKHRKTYSFYSSDYTDTQAIFYFGGFNGHEEQNIVFQLVLNKLVPTFRRVDYSGSPPSSINPIVQTYNENSILIISGQANYREVRLFRIKQRTFTLISSFPQMGRFGGLGSSLNLYGSDYYLFYGLGQNGYIGTISRFSISQRIKESDLAKKKKEKMHQFLMRSTNQLSSTSSNDSLNF